VNPRPILHLKSDDMFFLAAAYLLEFTGKIEIGGVIAKKRQQRLEVIHVVFCTVIVNGSTMFQFESD